MSLSLLTHSVVAALDRQLMLLVYIYGAGCFFQTNSLPTKGIPALPGMHAH